MKGIIIFFTFLSLSCFAGGGGADKGITDTKKPQIAKTDKVELDKEDAKETLLKKELECYKQEKEILRKQIKRILKIRDYLKKSV